MRAYEHRAVWRTNLGTALHTATLYARRLALAQRQKARSSRLSNQPIASARYFFESSL